MILFPASICLFSCCSPADARKAPTHPLVLRSPQIEVILDRDDALPYEYRLIANQAVIHGEDSGRAITATVFRAYPREFTKVAVKPQSVKATKTRADFLF